MELAQTTAYRYGLTPNEFWGLTPYDTFKWIGAQVDRDTDLYKLALWQAWHTAVYTRAKRLDKTAFENTLKRMGQKKRQMPAKDMVKVEEKSLAMFGGTDKRKGGSKRPSP